MKTMTDNITNYIGAIGGVLGATSGIYTYWHTGSRVRVKVTIAIRLRTGEYIAIHRRKFDGTFGHGFDFGGAQMMVRLHARNVGRLPIDVEGATIKCGKMSMLTYGTPLGEQFPVRMDFGTSKTWYFPLDMAMDLATFQGNRSPIGGSVDLANGRKPKTIFPMRHSFVVKVIHAWNSWNKSSRG
jgi:hypothetical protein